VTGFWNSNTELCHTQGLLGVGANSPKGGWVKLLGTNLGRHLYQEARHCNIEFQHPKLVEIVSGDLLSKVRHFYSFRFSIFFFQRYLPRFDRGNCNCAGLTVPKMKREGRQGRGKPAVSRTNLICLG
jgi:hypothetical protein